MLSLANHIHERSIVHLTTPCINSMEKRIIKSKEIFPIRHCKVLSVVSCVGIDLPATLRGWNWTPPKVKNQIIV